ncbi:MAG: DUF3392 family protein [Fibrobacteres bacterium]|nr:DUF3392 family protein [Fibrobacterota bacterium]
MIDISKEYHSLMQFLSGYIHLHIKQVVMAFAATILAVFGKDINRLVFKIMGKRHFLIRVLVYVLLCSFGFAFLTALTSDGMMMLFSKVDRKYLPFIIPGLFLLLGILAERKSQI